MKSRRLEEPVCKLGSRVDDQTPRRLSDLSAYALAAYPPRQVGALLEVDPVRRSCSIADTINAMPPLELAGVLCLACVFASWAVTLIGLGFGAPKLRTGSARFPSPLYNESIEKLDTDINHHAQRVQASIPAFSLASAVQDRGSFFTWALESRDQILAQVGVLITRE